MLLANEIRNDPKNKMVKTQVWMGKTKNLVANFAARLHKASVNMIVASVFFFVFFSCGREQRTQNA